jgi:cytochrome c-type biogenesis protein CcmH/NrfG
MWTRTGMRCAAYRIDPVLWVREVLGVEPTNWQEEFLRAPRDASVLALTARQCGKTTTAAGQWRMRLSLCPVRSAWLLVLPGQSAEAVRRVCEP